MSDSRHRLDLYLSHRSGLVDYAAPIVGSRAGAEDVVQEAWLRFVAVQGAITQPASYLYRIVRNLALDHVRRDRGESSGDDASWLDSIADQAPGPEAHAVSRNELQRVGEALERLPERTRRAFELYRLQGYTLQQVADAMDISIGTVHQLVHTALRSCVDALE
ncbi:sigma-70 family RNA polymerase sigma factor [Pseudomonas sp. KB-10]|uniref:sigma-70 family RNA polymerase sigma factor n=1 Tax=Pseudomonas sp. KB-10 TaxID=2292264 RepID=UPI001BAF672E